MQFRDSFKALVHNETSLNSAIKFRYLKECITDKLSPIAQLPESEEGYADAWQLVVRQYEDPRKITASHFNQILSTKKINAESYEDIQRLYKEALTNITAVSKLMNKDELFDAFAAHIILGKLDHSRELYENDCSKCIPSWSMLQEFLEKRKQALGAMPFLKGAARSDQKLGAAQSQQNRSSPKPVNSFVSSQEPKCPQCSQSHWLNQCTTFKAFDVPQRSKKVREFKLCFNCFGSHTLKECTSKYTCRHCDKKHHSLLHPEAKPPRDNEQTAMITQLNPDADEFQQEFSCLSSSAHNSSTVMLSTA